MAASRPLSLLGSLGSNELGVQMPHDPFFRMGYGIPHRGEREAKAGR